MFLNLSTYLGRGDKLLAPWRNVPHNIFSSLNLSQHILLSRLRQISLLNTSLLNSQYRECIDIHSTQLSPLRLRERWVWFGLVWLGGSGEHNSGHAYPMHLPSGVQCTPLLLIKPKCPPDPCYLHAPK